MESNQKPNARIKSILNCKKPAFWIILAVLLAGIVAAVCFLMKSKKNAPAIEPEGTVRPDVIESTLPDFPGVTFRQTSGSVEAEENGRTRTLFTGMPVVNVFFEDVTGDGKPELCATVYFGSGIVDSHIVIYDYANKQSYTLWARGTYDYRLYTADGLLYVGKTPYMDDRQIDTGTLVMQDGALCCRWQSDSSSVPLIRELHESELLGEWLVEEERDINDNVLYTASIELWKEYDFKADGTVTYNETVPVSSDSELAFGHPVSYPYAVYDGYVQIGTRDGGNYLGYGRLDESGKLHLTIEVAVNESIYATVRRMGAISSEDDALAALRERYPEYFDLPTEKGLTVYVYQTAPDDYRFGLLPDPERQDNRDMSYLCKATLNEMQLILRTLHCSPDAVELRAVHNDLSNYHIDDAEIAGIRAMLFGE